MSISSAVPTKVTQQTSVVKATATSKVPAVTKDSPKRVDVKPKKSSSGILEHPFRIYDTPIKPHVETLATHQAPFNPSANAGYFDEFRKKNVAFSSSPKHQLIVPALNGDLVLRERRVIHPRPFLANMMSYILPIGTKATDHGVTTHVHLWSSAMPHNVKLMLDTYFVKWQRKILGTWTRENLELDHVAYREYMQAIDAAAVMTNLRPRRVYRGQPKDLEGPRQTACPPARTKNAHLHRCQDSRGCRSDFERRRPDRRCIQQDETATVESPSDYGVYP